VIQLKEYLDKRLFTNYKNYIFQCFLATVSIFMILLFLNVFDEAALIASLGATAFIIFALPSTYSSQPKRIIGGYIIGVLVGILCVSLAYALFSEMILYEKFGLIIFGSIAVGVSIFLMCATNMEHPPAAGIALGVVINNWDYHSLVYIFIAVFIMAGARKLLSPYLIDLI